MGIRGAVSDHHASLCSLYGLFFLVIARGPLLSKKINFIGQGFKECVLKNKTKPNSAKNKKTKQNLKSTCF